MLTRSRVNRSGIEKTLRALATLLITQEAPAFADVDVAMANLRAAATNLGLFDETDPTSATVASLARLDAYAVTTRKPMRDIAIGRALTALSQLREIRCPSSK